MVVSIRNPEVYRMAMIETRNQSSQQQSSTSDSSRVNISQPQQVIPQTINSSSIYSSNSSSNSSGIVENISASKKRRVNFQNINNSNGNENEDGAYEVAPKRARAVRYFAPRKKPTLSIGHARNAAPTMDAAIADSFSSAEGATLFHLCDPHFTKRRSVRESFSRLSPGTLQQISCSRLQAPRPGGRPASDSLAFQWEKAAADKAKQRESGPRVEIVDGKIVLKESSLVAGTAGTGPGGGPSSSGEPRGGRADHPQEDPEQDEDYMEEVEEGVHATCRYSSFRKRSSGSGRWSDEETQQFYLALRQCGTDFSMMSSFFPQRGRRALKLKFQREEEHHPQLVKCALFSGIPLDLSVFEERGGGSGSNSGGGGGEEAAAEEDDDEVVEPLGGDD